MNFAELIHKLSEFYFANIWRYLGLIILILVLRGDVSKWIRSVSNIFAKFKQEVKTRYQAREARAQIAENIKRNLPRDVKNVQKINMDKE